MGLVARFQRGTVVRESVVGPDGTIHCPFCQSGFARSGKNAPNVQCQCGAHYMSFVSAPAPTGKLFAGFFKDSLTAYAEPDIDKTVTCPFCRGLYFMSASTSLNCQCGAEFIGLVPSAMTTARSAAKAARHASNYNMGKGKTNAMFDNLFGARLDPSSIYNDLINRSRLYDWGIDIDQIGDYGMAEEKPITKMTREEHEERIALHGRTDKELIVLAALQKKGTPMVYNLRIESPFVLTQTKVKNALGPGFKILSIEVEKDLPNRKIETVDDAVAAIVQGGFRALARAHHPDLGGDTNTMVIVNRAKKELLELLESVKI